jgi:hypothetical protein
MNAEARRTLAVIRDCLANDRYAVTEHFAKRMQQRALFWPDVAAAIDAATELRSQGLDEFDRPKWIVCGQAANGLEIEIVCAVETDPNDTTFITLYWE